MHKINWTEEDTDLKNLSYDDFIYEYMNHHSDWSDYDEHPWEWYMEVSIRKSEGWQQIKISLEYKSAAVINWLKGQGAVYKNSLDEFLIKDPKIATLMRLKYA